MSMSMVIPSLPPSHSQYQRPSKEVSAPAVQPPSLPRRSSSLHRALLTRLRPLPFQYIFSLWHTKPSSATSITDTYSLTLLSPSVPDIASFYRIFNNLPWPSIRPRDSIHFFRSGVRPLWEDEQNIEGGCWVLKLRRDEGRAVRAWEEICVMCLGGMVQSVVAKERDHILGLSYSPRLYYAHISIWTKQGSNTRSIEMLEREVLSGLSEDLRPRMVVKEECYYKRHEDHEGWREVVGKDSTRR